MVVKVKPPSISHIKHQTFNITQYLTYNSGYTLYLVMVILFIAGILFTVSLRASSVAHIQSVRHIHSLQAKFLAQSGIARAEYFLNGGDGHDLNWETDRLEETIDNFGTIVISCVPFGLLSKINSTGNRLNESYTLEEIMGRDIPRTIESAITLTGHVGGLVLAKGTTIQGTVVLHHGTVKRGNNKSPIPGSEKWVKQMESPPLPFDIRKITDFMNESANTIALSISSKTALNGHCTITGSNDSLLTSNPLIINGDCSIGAVELDNVSVIVTGELKINKGALCRKSSFLAGKITIVNGISKKSLFFSNDVLTIKGGVHKAQFFSNDSIVIEKEAQFPGSSLWISHRIQDNDTTITGGIVFSEKGNYSGHAVCFTDSIEGKSEILVGPSVALGEGSVFNGTIITDGDINLKRVTVNGHIYCRSVVAVDNKMSYKNWLLGCSHAELEKEIPFPLIGDLPAKVSLIE